MWTATAMKAWISDLGIRPGGIVDVELLDVGGVGADIPDHPDRMALIIPTSGAGETTEGLFDRPGFQLRLRWRTGDPLGAEVAALTADKLIRRAVRSCRLADGTYLLDVQRVGGRPTQLGAAAEDGDRTTYVSSYITEINDD
jgi:hypothetical protein